MFKDPDQGQQRRYAPVCDVDIQQMYGLDSWYLWTWQMIAARINRQSA